MTNPPIPMLDLARLHAPLKDRLMDVFAETLESGQFIGGPAVVDFEQALAHYIGARGAVGVNSGTDALLVAMMALQAGPGDEVITTPYTFFATAGSIVRLGATPVFVDIDPVTFNIDAAGIEEAITEKTVGIIPVHLFGQCAPMESIWEIASRKRLWILEDAAQALGAEYKGQAAGTMGIAGVFSFFPAKNLGAMGDGGAVVSNDATILDRVNTLRHHGAKTKYHHQTVGGNFRLDALQAALLQAKLPSLAEWEEGRRTVARRYGELFADVDPVVVPMELADGRHVFNQYVIRVPERDKVEQALSEARIGCAVYYPVPLHLQACFSNLNFTTGDLPNAEAAAEQSLAIPIDPLLTKEDQLRVVQVIKGALQ
jgi:dTDP-4-amino-4,6-dideoxygalactose transaminase